ncbi:HNH endonuclease [Azospirillum halopraeferens]|uniref:HNH endonuclease n=1 Tax=Azospirillum halopraeferens TaxID=34010 RepID=UPI000411DC8E|nr:HNH endonuclease signature motif containing protein [Azospirillum halopraeferens]
MAVSRDDALLMDVAQGGRCFYCGESVGAKATFDHLIPRAYGGADEPANVVLAHGRCNRRKGDRLPTPDEVDRLIRQRRGSRLGVWPPLVALRDAEPGEEWIAVARAIANLLPR